MDGNKLLVGANFASAGIGVLNDTGIQFVSRALSIIPFTCNVSAGGPKFFVEEVHVHL